MLRRTPWIALALPLLACPAEHSPSGDSGWSSYDSGSQDAVVLDAQAPTDSSAGDSTPAHDTASTSDATACAQGCGAHEQCNVSSGLCECIDGYHLCGQTCVDDDALAHCGTSCDPCPTTDHGTSTCDGVSCGITCDPDYLWCGARCAPCPTDGVATTSCASGNCVAATCEQGYTPCGNGCCRFTLDNVETGAEPRMALDADDEPVLVYLQGDSILRVATPTGAGWQKTTLHEETTSGRITDPDIALDADEIPHVVYSVNQTNASSTLMHAYRDPGGWIFETVLQTTGALLDARLAIASDDTIYVVFHNWDDGTLLLASSSGTWSIEEVDRGFQLGRYCDIELDDAEEPHLSFMADNELRYAYHDGVEWQFQVVATEATYYIVQSNLHFDPQGRPRIGAFRDSPRNVLYAAFNGLTWDLVEVDRFLGLFAGGVAMDLTAGGTPHLSYVADSADEVRHAYKTGSSWSIEVVDRTSASDHTALAIDSTGSVHIAYRNGNGDVVHAH